MTHALEGGPTDIIVTVVAFLCVIFLVFSSIYVFAYGDWQPFSFKQTPLVLLNGLSGAVFISATIVANNHYSRYPSNIFGWCHLWRIWLQGLFGFAPWISCLIIRCYRLYRIFTLLRGEPKNRYWIYLGVLMFPWFIYALVVTLMKGQRYDDIKKICSSTDDNWTIAGFALIGFYICLFLIMAILTRKIRDEFNEYLVIRRGAAVCIFLALSDALIQLVVKHALDVSVTGKVAARALSTGSVVLGVTYFFFAGLIVPIYHHMFNREEYMKEFTLQYQKNTQEGVKRHMSKVNLKAVEVVKAANVPRSRREEVSLPAVSMTVEEELPQGNVVKRISSSGTQSNITPTQSSQPV